MKLIISLLAVAWLVSGCQTTGQKAGTKSDWTPLATESVHASCQQDCTLTGGVRAHCNSYCSCAVGKWQQEFSMDEMLALIRATETTPQHKQTAQTLVSASTQCLCEHGIGETKTKACRYLQAQKPKRDGTKWKKRSIAIQWNGISELIAGEILFTRSSKNGTMKATLPKAKGECNGTYAMSGKSKGGVWSIACPDGLTASGTLTAFGKSKGASGNGLDNSGRSVKFSVAGG